MKLVDSVDAMQEIAARLQTQRAPSTWQDPSIAASKLELKALEAQLRDLIDKRNARGTNPSRFQRPLSSAPRAVDEPYSWSCANSSR
ncbi:hypothetical protein KCP70_19030 [Salmonella enterica subsp. enterica]|nr:hypothetical protein KCP70_19030 [Salmonella enterica subsp. enterica]